MIVAPHSCAVHPARSKKAAGVSRASRESVAPGLLEARRVRADKERRALVAALQRSYDEMCAAFPHGSVAELLRPRTQEAATASALARSAMIGNGGKR